ncbi:unnamed protein product [Mortierella alpina]
MRRYARPVAVLLQQQQQHLHRRLLHSCQQSEYIASSLASILGVSPRGAAPLRSALRSTRTKLPPPPSLGILHDHSPFYSESTHVRFSSTVSVLGQSRNSTI